MAKRILVLGATGMLGQPVARSLHKRGHQIRILVRNIDKARRMFGNKMEIIRGDVLNRANIQTAISDCAAVHINLPQDSELIAMQHLTETGKNGKLERITYVSATTVCEANRWFEMIDVKMQTETVLRSSGIASTVFCPTWAMETLHNLIRGDRAVIIIGRNPPPLHFVAAADFGRVVAASYDDDRALGKRLFIHGPEAVTLPDAFERFVKACYSGYKVMRMKLWQAQLLAKLTGRAELNYITRLIAYFDRVGELGDPEEANVLFGAPAITLNKWFKMQEEPAN